MRPAPGPVGTGQPSPRGAGAAAASWGALRHSGPGESPARCQPRRGRAAHGQLMRGGASGHCRERRARPAAARTPGPGVPTPAFSGDHHDHTHWPLRHLSRVQLEGELRPRGEVRRGAAWRRAARRGEAPALPKAAERRAAWPHLLPTTDSRSGVNCRFPLVCKNCCGAHPLSGHGVCERMPKLYHPPHPLARRPIGAVRSVSSGTLFAWPSWP